MNKVKFLVSVPAAIAAGFINGLLGTGGGIILVFLFAFINKDRGDISSKDNFASTVAAIIPVSVVSAVLYSAGGSLDIISVLPFLIPGALGGIAGALLNEKLTVRSLNTIFSLFVIYAGASMLVKK